MVHQIMSGEKGTHDESQNPAGIRRRRIDPDPSTAEYDFLAIIAELEDCEIDALPPLYNEVEHVVETMFKTPPSERSHLEISFSYAGYRVSIDTDGMVDLVPVKQSQ